jgi:hypothetical protein
MAVMAEHDTDPREPGLAALLTRLFRESETLMLQQLALFRAEIGENAGRFAGALAVLLAGLLLCLLGALALVAALILLLGKIMPLWLSAGLTGAAVAVLGAGLVLYARRRLARASLVPRQSWQAVRETGEWLRDELT